MLLAFLLYNDGISTIIKMASIYGTEIGIETRSLLLRSCSCSSSVSRARCSSARLAARIGTKRTLYLSLALYVGIAGLAYFMHTAAHFFALAIAVGFVQGGAQALSRSLFASLIPRQRSSEFFGFFAVLEKFAGILGPALLRPGEPSHRIEPECDPERGGVLRVRSAAAARRGRRRRAAGSPRR